MQARMRTRSSRLPIRRSRPCNARPTEPARARLIGPPGDDRPGMPSRGRRLKHGRMRAFPRAVVPDQVYDKRPAAAR